MMYDITTMKNVSYESTFLNLKKSMVVEANRLLHALGCAPATWGNVSMIDRDHDQIIIKPSGVAFDSITCDNVSVVDLSTHNVLSGLKPSVDLNMHIAMYDAWCDVISIAHGHPLNATSFAQACLSIEMLGTTHADTFAGAVPCIDVSSAAAITPETIIMDHASRFALYGTLSGECIVKYFADAKIDHNAVSAALLMEHGALTWSTDSAHDAVIKMDQLELIAEMAIKTKTLMHQRNNAALSLYRVAMMELHKDRKHGAYKQYGQ